MVNSYVVLEVEDSQLRVTHLVWWERVAELGPPGSQSGATRLMKFLNERRGGGEEDFKSIIKALYLNKYCASALVGIEARTVQPESLFKPLPTCCAIASNGIISDVIPFNFDSSGITCCSEEDFPPIGL